MAGFGTMAEINSTWTINQLADALEALDIKDEAESFYMNANRKK